MFNYLKTQQLNARMWLGLVTLLMFAAPIVQIILNGSGSLEITINHPLVKLIITILVVWLASMLMNNICNRSSFLNEKSNLPAALTIILGSQLIAYSYLELGSFLLMIFIINKLLKTYGKSYPLINYFDIGLLIGILSIIHLPNLLLVFALVLYATIFANERLKIYKFIFISLSFVWLFYSAYLFINDKLYILLIDIYTAYINFLSFSVEQINSLHCIIFILGIISALYSVSKKRFLSGFQAPILFSSTIFLFICSLISVMFLEYDYEPLTLGIVPVIILSSYYFFNVNEKLANILFYLLIITIIIFQWYFPLQII